MPQAGTGASFLLAFPFPLPILIPPTVPYSLMILSSTMYSLDSDSIFKYKIKQEVLGRLFFLDAPAFGAEG
jgi:hypothetical protein